METLSRALCRHLSAALVLAAILCCSGCRTTVPVPEAPKRYAFWPPYPDKPKIQFLMSYSRSGDVELRKDRLNSLIYGKEARRDLAINKPYGVEMHNGRIYVCDQRAGHVTILDLRNRQVLLMGATGAQRLASPSDIAIAEDGMKYVTDVIRRAVLVFDDRDRYVTRISRDDLSPTGVEVYGDEVFVCDFGKQRIDVFDRRNGELRRTLGESPSGTPPLIPRPLGIAAGPDGSIYVTDVLTCRVHKFDPQGNPVTAFGARSAMVGGLTRPKHVDVDADGTIYIVDAAFQNVQLFDDVGRVFTFFGGGGNFPGGMNLPVGIAVHDGDLDLFADLLHPAFEAKRLLVVTNQFGLNKISLYALGDLREGATVQDISGSEGVVPTGPPPGTGAPPLPANPSAPPPDDPVGSAGAERERE